MIATHLVLFGFFPGATPSDEAGARTIQIASTIGNFTMECAISVGVVIELASTIGNFVMNMQVTVGEEDEPAGTSAVRSFVRSFVDFFVRPFVR